MGKGDKKVKETTEENKESGATREKTPKERKLE